MSSYTISDGADPGRCCGARRRRPRRGLAAERYRVFECEQRSSTTTSACGPTGCNTPTAASTTTTPAPGGPRHRRRRVLLQDQDAETARRLAHLLVTAADEVVGGCVERDARCRLVVVLP